MTRTASPTRSTPALRRQLAELARFAREARVFRMLAARAGDLASHERWSILSRAAAAQLEPLVLEVESRRQAARRRARDRYTPHR